MKNKFLKSVKKIWDDFWLVNPEDKWTYRATIIGAILFFSFLFFYVYTHGK